MTTLVQDSEVEPTDRRTRATRWGVPVRTAAVVIALIVAAVSPYYVPEFWLQTGLFFMAAAVGAMGLGMLTGVCGQLSLAHSFFLAVGAYCYVLFASPSETVLGGARVGLGLPPIVAMVLAVAAAGVAGLIFSPVAARVRGLYLGVASIGLVFLGQHILFNATALTGGFNGRAVPGFELLGLSFAADGPDWMILGVAFGHVERLWYLFIAVGIVSYLFARNIVAGRPGRAMSLLRDQEPAAIAMGVNPSRLRGKAFLYSSMFAGLAGVLLALVYQHIVPETFSLLLAINYLVMIVIGGIDRVAGAVLGALFVTLIPALLQKFGNQLPFLADASRSGIGAAELAAMVYGAAVIAVVLYEPDGLYGLGGRIARFTKRSVRRAGSQEGVNAGS